MGAIVTSAALGGKLVWSLGDPRGACDRGQAAPLPDFGFPPQKENGQMGLHPPSQLRTQQRPAGQRPFPVGKLPPPQKVG